MGNKLKNTLSSKTTAISLSKIYILKFSNLFLSKMQNFSDFSEDNFSQDSFNTNSTVQKKGKWTPEEDELLYHFVPMYNEKNWHKICQQVPGRTSVQCLHRWTKILKPGLVKGMWTPEEDEALAQWVEDNGAQKWP